MELLRCRPRQKYIKLILMLAFLSEAHYCERSSDRRLVEFGKHLQEDHQWSRRQQPAVKKGQKYNQQIHSGPEFSRSRDPAEEPESG